MDVGPKCITCNVEQMLTSTTPVANGHEMRQFECPQCKGVFRLVIRRTTQPDDLTFALD